MPFLQGFRPERLAASFDSPDDFGVYHDLHAAGSDVSRGDRPFRAVILGYRFPRMLLFSRQVSGVIHDRSVSRVRHDGFDHFNLQLLQGGHLAGGLPGKEHVLHPGEAVFFDTTRPQRMIVDEADYLSVTLARELVEAVLPQARDLHGAVLPSAAVGLLSDFLASLLRRASHLGPDAAARSTTMVGELLAAAVAEGGASSIQPIDDAETMALLRARGEAYIEAHLGDSDLNAAGIAAGIGVSRSSLYRAFAPVDGVMRQITARRLDRLRLALLRPEDGRSVSVLTFAIGFRDESHCNRAFKAAYGLPPGQFRTTFNRSRRTSPPSRGVPRLTEWYSGIY